MFKKVLFLLILLGLFAFTQCSGGLFEPVVENVGIENPEINNMGLPAESATAGGSRTAGSGGGPGGGKDKDQEESSSIYGDLIICLRDVNGIPEYKIIDGEHGVAYYPLPIKFDAVSLLPVMDGNTYLTFDLNDEGDVITEEGYFVKEVEFGRLNLIRAPQSVLDQALDEAVSSLTQSGVTGYKTDASGRLVAIIGAEDWVVNYDGEEANTPEEYDDKTIDSPRENMAIYQELMSHQFSHRLSFLANNRYELGEHFTSDDLLRLAYGAIAAGSDKTGTLTVDELAYMNNWLLILFQDEAINSPDERNRFYYNFTNYKYSREETYKNKFVRKTILKADGTWDVVFESLLDAVDWTAPEKLVRYGNENENITGFAKASDDAVQVLEYIHESDLIVYSPWFTADGFVSP